MTDTLKRTPLARPTDLSKDDERWWNHFEALEAIWLLENDPNVPRKHQYGPWISRQRAMYSANNLESFKIQAMETIGIVWKPFQQRFNDKLKGLQDIALKNGGDPNVPISHPTHGDWLNNLRATKKAGKLSQERIRALEALGVVWKPYEERWDERFIELKKVLAIVDSRKDLSLCDFTHADWLYKQNGKIKKGKLCESKIQALAAIGFV